MLLNSPVWNKLLGSHTRQGNNVNNVYDHGGAGARSLLVVEFVSRVRSIKMTGPI
jgi:hypothetical protein